MRTPTQRTIAWMESLRGCGGATPDEWLAGHGFGGPAAYGLFRQPEDGEAAVVRFYNSEDRHSGLMVCQHLADNLWCNIVEPVAVFEWPDADVLVLSAASRIGAAWTLAADGCTIIARQTTSTDMPA